MVGTLNLLKPSEPLRRNFRGRKPSSTSCRSSQAQFSKANRSEIDAREWFNLIKPVSHMSTSKILEVSKEHAQWKSQAAFRRGFLRGVNKPTMRQTRHTNDFVNAKSHAREKPLLAG